MSNNQLENQFSIKANTFTLKQNIDDNKNVVLNEDLKYVIPIYQRPYSWTEEQITKFISDIFISFYGYDKNSKPEPMFIGTMQLSGQTKQNGHKIEQEVVDGQQRLTTFILLLKLLSKEFNDNNELKNLNFDWLETKVNSGEQQKFLTTFLNAETYPILNEETLNPYLKNAAIIQQLLNEEFKDELGNSINFDIDAFINHLYSNIYFVIIETFAGLSKTLQIFDAINTTGLDLNGSDIFKIKMYEYLKDFEKKDDSVFEEISSLYAKVDRLNLELDSNIAFSEILGIYSDILISKYSLNTSLYSLGADTFFERLFDTIFNIKVWKDFNNAHKVQLSIDELEKIIDARFLWEKLPYPTFEDSCLMHITWWSRYRRFWTIIIIFIYKYNPQKNDLFLFTNRLNKLYFLYSIYFDRAINNIYTFTHRLIDKIINDENIVDIIESIENKIHGEVPYYELEGKLVFEKNLNGDIVYNPKKKNLICRVSAMLDEEYKKQTNSDKLKEYFFNNAKFPNDIEHIQSFNDENLSLRDKIKQEWGENLNSIGNLVILERDINRSISNNCYPEKVKEYTKSKFSIVQKQVKNHKEWTLEDCKNRKEKEITKLSSYLFDSIKN
ncbi:DUF262 domain-containing HNH endonuclease family protein [Aestuariibaculum sp. M13]|uniref:DUF262 domain-containing protein n=1 Tax=Aestuariibaculum sp. M13 TaxID=2967132 RepID=UPI002159F71F|nr:DUF262 domain-containing HNH endonuclease family protein [Aestuariibaculum sp. M13]MCR8667947.1 DUF262 domain-containing HNH endonuclease family protein [Aestuariibaculum sp. M13]